MITNCNPFVVVKNIKFLDHSFSSIDIIHMERIVQMPCLVKCHRFLASLLVTCQIMIDAEKVFAFKLSVQFSVVFRFRMVVVEDNAAVEIPHITMFSPNSSSFASKKSCIISTYLGIAHTPSRLNESFTLTKMKCSNMPLYSIFSSSMSSFANIPSPL